MVFGGSEEGFGEGVVVADTRAGVRGCDLKLVHETKDSSRFERAAVVSMKHQRGALVGDFFVEMRALQKGVGVVGVFLGEDFGSDDLAAIEVEDEVEFVIDAADLGGQPGDIPGPYLVGTDGLVVGAWFGFGGFAGAAPAFVEAVVGKDPVEGGFGGKVGAFVKEGGDDLGRGRGGEAGREADVDDLLSFFCAELIGLRGAFCGGALVTLGRAVEIVLPAFECPGTELHDFGTATEPGSVLSGFFHEGEEVFALFEST